MIYAVIKNKEVIDIFDKISEQQRIDLRFRGFIIRELYTRDDFIKIMFESGLVVQNPGFTTILKGLMELS